MGVMEGEIIKGVVKGKRREPPKLVLPLVKIYDKFSQACGGGARETMLIASVVSVLDTSSQLTALKLYRLWDRNKLYCTFTVSMYQASCLL